MFRGLRNVLLKSAQTLHRCANSPSPHTPAQIWKAKPFRSSNQRWKRGNWIAQSHSRCCTCMVYFYSHCYLEWPHFTGAQFSPACSTGSAKGSWLNHILSESSYRRMCKSDITQQVRKHSETKEGQTNSLVRMILGRLTSVHWKPAQCLG